MSACTVEAEAEKARNSTDTNQISDLIKRTTPPKLQMEGKIPSHDIDEPNWSDSLFQVDDFNGVRLSHTDSTLVFYRITKSEVELLSDTLKSSTSFYFFKNIDIDFDGKKEVVTYSYSNMNGNQFCEIFNVDVTKKKIVSKGNLIGGFEMNQQTKSIFDYYRGSWYMGEISTEHFWVDEKFVIKKELVLKKEFNEQGTAYQNRIIFSEFDSLVGDVHITIDEDFDSVRYETLLSTFTFEAD